MKDKRIPNPTRRQPFTGGYGSHLEEESSEDTTDEVVTLLAESAFSPSETAEGARDEGCVTLSMMNSW